MSSLLIPCDRLQLALFSGKGGVGKTTLSCSFARRWAKQFPDERILLLSTDPAHSLGDVLQLTVEDSPHSLPDLPNLQVRSLNAEALLQDFRNQYGAILELLVERGSFVQGADLQPIWDLGFPGLDELMSLLEIQRLLRDKAADRIVVDTAPSGHTLNLLGLMDFLDGFLGALELFQAKHHAIQKSFTGQTIDDAADAFLRDMQADLAAGRSLLQNPLTTACFVVAIAQPLSYLETQRFLAALNQLQIPCGGLFLNHILTEAAPLDVLIEQQEYLSKFAELTSHCCQDSEAHRLFLIPRQSQAPVGPSALDSLLSRLTSLFDFSPPLPLQPSSRLPTYLPPLPDFIAQGKRLLIIGGKGGVGKTTVTAAIAWGMATQHPQKSVRVISIDPAHSLGDAFGATLGHFPTELLPNLSAQEIDADRMLDQFRADYLWELAAMMSGDPGDDDEQLRLAYSPQAWRQLVNQALPGIDEMLSLISVMELLESGNQQLIVLDTAPTGHLLRFLEMPSALADWLSWIFKLWMKYQDVAGHVDLMGRLRSLRQRVVNAQKKLKDPNYTEFIGVVQNQSAILAEAQRLTQTLAEMGLLQRYLVHNRYTPGHDLQTDCFPQQTVVRLGELQRAIAPLQQIQAAAEGLFSQEGVGAIATKATSEVASI
ncbi:MAG TPA: ArsA family ATPase [Synechococcales cyanobacterium M55_K2018_004]|nr:ArsA family ATPase [Synechococcales cyanobacterium M55_K2018_004]